MNTLPLVSVVMPVYNGEAYLQEAIESILDQTFKDFEFIIINDGSSDNSEKIILEYAKKDKRIVYVKNERNFGIVRALNKGISLAKGKYIARMDADDISLPKRFEIQVKYMERHRDVGVCGTWVKTFGDKEEIWKMPLKHEDIVMSMLFNSAILHPTVFIRKNVIINKNLYSEAYNKVEDYKLWTELAHKTKFANIGGVFLFYRIRESSVRRKEYKKLQKEFSNRVRKEYLEKLKIPYTQEELNLYLKVCNYDLRMNTNQIEKLKEWFFKIVEHNKKINFTSNKACVNILANKLYAVCVHNLNNNSKIWRIFFDFLKRCKSKRYILLGKLILKEKIGIP